ncbi:MAG: cohesin domain-containing protein, partial [Bryobacteraceae bacterium]
DRTELLIAVIPHVVRTPNFTKENLKTIAAGSEAVVKLSYAPTEQEEAAPSQPAAPAAPSPVPSALPPAPGARARLLFLPSALQAQVAGPVNVSLRIENAEDLVSAPVKIKYDPKILRLNDITPGDLLTRGNQNVTSPKDIRNDTGEATITITRAPGAGGVNGSGTLATLSFLAIGKGATQIAVTEAGLKNSKQQPVTVQPPVLNVTVQ